MIYFLKTLAGDRIKIGYTGRHPDLRRLQLESSEKTKLTLLGVMDGDVSRERAVHAQFGPHRLNGEWFRPHRDLLSFIETRAGPLEALIEPYDDAPKVNGFSVYPDDETLKRLDKMAGLQDRKRSPMAVIAMKRGLDMLEREAKSK